MKTNNTTSKKSIIIIILTVVILLISSFLFVKYYGTSDGSDPDIMYNFDHVFPLHSEERAMRVYATSLTGSGIIYWTLNEELSDNYNDVCDYYMVRLVNWSVDYEHTIQETRVRE